MRVPNIVIGQRVHEDKVLRAKELRQNMTPEEKIVWNEIRANRLRGFHFRRQQVIDGFIVDFYCHVAGLIVEIDGPVHDAQVDSDRDRDNVLCERGLSVLRFKNEDVRTALADVLKKIAASCEARASTPPPAPPRSGEGRK